LLICYSKSDRDAGASHRHAKKEKRPLPAGAARTEMNAFAHGRILHTFNRFVKRVRVEKYAIVQEQIMQIANKRA